MDHSQRVAAKIALAVLAADGFLLAGGQALIERGITQRLSDDIDLFALHRRRTPATFAASVQKMTAALEAAGYTVGDHPTVRGIRQRRQWTQRRSRRHRPRTGLVGELPGHHRPRTDPVPERLRRIQAARRLLTRLRPRLPRRLLHHHQPPLHPPATDHPLPTPRPDPGPANVRGRHRQAPDAPHHRIHQIRPGSP